VAATKCVYDGDIVLQKYDGLGATLTEYTSTSRRYGDLLSAYDGSAAKYYEPDALASTDALANQSQTVMDRWRCRAFGDATRLLATTRPRLLGSAGRDKVTKPDKDEPVGNLVVHQEFLISQTLTEIAVFPNRNVHR
jgi:hypothetical protein